MEMQEEAALETRSALAHIALEMGTEGTVVDLQEVRHDAHLVPQEITGAVQADDLVGNTIPNSIRWPDHL